MKYLTAFLFILVFQLSSFSQANDFQTAIQQSQKIIESVQKESQVPGIVAFVSIKGKEVWAEGFGFADLELQVKADPHRTKFRIGSISKPYTALALAQLYEAGKIDLDAPIQQYVPEFPKKKYEVTLRQLGGHIAGIRHYNGNEFMSSQHYASVSDGLVIFKDDPLLHQPNTKYAYSSYAWNLISAAIETASGEEFLSYVQKHIFDALNMENSDADQNLSIIPNRSKFYSLQNEEIINGPYVDNSYKWAGGGFISSAEDVVKFAEAHMKAGALKAETLKLWTSPQKTKDGKSTNYGIGWRSYQDKKGRQAYGHTGGSVGGSSRMIIYPKEEIVIVLLSNLGGVSYKNADFKIAEQFLTILEKD